MTEKQEKLLCLYREIDTICKNNNIEYYMSGGTLIGAIRHRGFIPWDDDMDLYITRDNWLKFLKACETELPENRVVECQELDRGYYNMFGRYIDTQTTAIHSAQFVYDDTAGFVVDIFVLDPLADDDEFYNNYMRDLMLYSDLICNSVVYSYRWSANKYRYGLYRLYSAFAGKEKVLSKLENRMFSYPQEKCSRFALRWGGAPFIFDKKMFDGVKWSEFEGISCPIPSQTSAYLTWHYGDEWMFIPSHDEQESHEAVYSLKTNFKPVRNEIDAILPRNKLKKIYRKRKSRILDSMNAFHDTADNRIEVRALAYKLDFNKEFEKEDSHIEDLFENNKFTELGKVFSDYFSAQFSADFIGREDFANIYRFHKPVMIDIADKYIIYSVYTLINTERISKSMRLIDLYEITKGDLLPELQTAKKLILDFRKSTDAYEEKDYTQTSSIIFPYLEKYPACVSFIKFKIRLLLEENNIDKNYNEISQLIERGLSILPNNGDFLKNNADLLFMTDKKQAIFDYISAYFLTNNGITQLEIYDIIMSSKELVLNSIDDCILTNDIENVTELIDNLLEIVPGDIDFYTKKCKLYFVHFQNNSEFYNIAEAMIRNIYIDTKCNEAIFSEYEKLVSLHLGDKRISYIFIKLRLTDEYEENEKLLDEIKNLANAAKESGQEKNLIAWYEYFIGYAYINLGKIKKSYSHFKKALSLCDDEILLACLQKRFMNDLKYTGKFLNFSRGKVITDKMTTTVNSDTSRRLSDVVMTAWSKKYPTVESAVELYHRIGILSDEMISYIRLFGLIGLSDDPEAECAVWTISRFKLFLRICNRVMKKSEFDLFDDESNDELATDHAEENDEFSIKKDQNSTKKKLVSLDSDDISGDESDVESFSDSDSDDDGSTESADTDDDSDEDNDNNFSSLVSMFGENAEDDSD